MHRLNALDFLALILVIVGALNWGMVGLFNLNVVSTIFADMNFVSNLIFVLVACAGLYLLITLGKFAKKK